MEFEDCADDDPEEDSAYRPALFGVFGDARLPNLSAMRRIIRSQSCVERYVLVGIWERGIVKEPGVVQRDATRLP